MIPSRIIESSIEELNDKTQCFVGASGYEERATAFLPKLAASVKHRIAIGFTEHTNEFSRAENDRKFEQCHFEPRKCSGNDSAEVQNVATEGLRVAKKERGAIAFDISSMTRSWHGAIVRTLIVDSSETEVDTYFVYVPRKFEKPPKENPPNQIVGPVEGFGALSPPDLPIALLLSLGHERDRALGFMEILDPGRTVLMIPRTLKKDPFYTSVLKNNSEVLRRASERWVFEYRLWQPAATFRMLESICGGLDLSHRIVMAPMGPKLFGLLCFLMAAKYREMSVWRMSSGMHAKPCDVSPDADRPVILKVTWAPETAPA